MYSTLNTLMELNTDEWHYVDCSEQAEFDNNYHFFLKFASINYRYTPNAVGLIL